MANNEKMVDGELLELAIQGMTEASGTVRDLNLVVRGLPPTPGAVAEINARIDAAQFAMKEIERLIAGTVTEFQEIRKAIEGMQDTWKEMKTMVEALPAKISIPSEKIDGLRKETTDLTAQLHVPLKQEVVHEHHLDAHWIITLILFLAVMIFMILYFKS